MNYRPGAVNRVLARLPAAYLPLHTLKEQVIVAIEHEEEWGLGTADAWSEWSQFAHEMV